MINLEHKYIGITFLNMQFKKKTVESWSEKFNGFLVQEEEMPCKDIMSESDIKFFLDRQFIILESKRNSEEREESERIKKEQEEHEKNFCHGFCDSLTPMQKGKVLQVLNKQYRYPEPIKGTMSRKEFIFKALEAGYKPSIEHDVKYYSNRTECGYTVKPTVYSIIWGNGCSMEITKVEYDYSLYLLTKILF